MIIHKINATTSTNTYLKELIKDKNFFQETAVFALNQTEGRGQMGNSWYSQEGKSLTFSAFKRLSGFDVAQQFYISIAVSCAIKKVLEAYNIDGINIKWPNDILSAGKKIGGILIENIVNQKQVKGAVVGIGLNVNETQFKQLPNATSMRLVSGKEFEIETIFQSLLTSIDTVFRDLSQKHFSQLKQYYLTHLYRKGEVSVFENIDKQVFNGIIRGVSEEGKLQVEIEEGTILLFDLKEIRMLNGL